MTLTMYAEQGPSSSSPALYSLDLDVSSYERLRRQESLLVDFTEFLNNMVWLLEQACGGGGASGAGGAGGAGAHLHGALNGNTTQPINAMGPASSTLHTIPRAVSHPAHPSHSSHTARSFRAVLCCLAGGATSATSSATSSATPLHLQIKEHTAFRELAHLTLPIQTNTDKGMARFLALRLKELTDDNQRCRATIASLEQDGRALEQQLSALHDQVSADTSLHSNEASNWKMQCDMMHAQVVNANEQNDFLREKVRAAEAAAASDNLRLTTAETACKTMRDEIQRLKKETESSARTSAALQDAKLHNERELSRLRDLCEGYKSASDTADARVEDWKRMAKSHEEQAAKVGREAQQLERKLAQTTQELEQARKRLHETEHRAAQRDALMQTQEEALQSAQSRVTDLQQQQRALEAQVEEARKQAEEATQRESEAAKKSENSEKMIVWLNKQLTNIQLKGGRGGGVGSGSGKDGPDGMRTPSPLGRLAR